MSGNTFKTLMETLKGTVKSAGDAGRSVTDKVHDLFNAVEKEAKIGPALHEQVLAALAQMKQKNPAIDKLLKEAHGFAVLPDVGKATAVLGVAYGIGEVFEQRRVIGYAALVQMTLGVQIGGETFHELIVFHSPASLKRFKSGKYGFAANAAVALVKAKAEASHGFGEGTSVYVYSQGGLQLVTSIGVQKFIYRPAALGRMRTVDRHTKAGKMEEPEEAPAEAEDHAEAEGDEASEPRASGEEAEARE